MGEKMKGFDIAPETFILPNDYIPFVQSFKRRADAIGSNRNFWIIHATIRRRLTPKELDVKLDRTNETMGRVRVQQMVSVPR